MTLVFETVLKTSCALCSLPYVFLHILFFPHFILSQNCMYMYMFNQYSGIMFCFFNAGETSGALYFAVHERELQRCIVQNKGGKCSNITAVLKN